MKELIQKLANTGDEIYAKICEVISVDIENQTADLQPLDGSAEILDALIQVAENGVLIEPKVNSLVACVFVSKELAVIVNHSEIKQFGFQIENISFVANKDEIQLNGDTYKGLVKVEQLTQKLNAIETAFNQLVNEFNAHTHNAPQAPAGTLPTLTPLVPSTQNLNSTQVGDLENEKVKHG